MSGIGDYNGLHCATLVISDPASLNNIFLVSLEGYGGICEKIFFARKVIFELKYSIEAVCIEFLFSMYRDLPFSLLSDHIAIGCVEQSSPPQGVEDPV
jgi:hypothetical protein